ncbi:MAG: hypothetical protein KDG54_11150 [Geminicoccaceae bacterium]|nr:hypothetical protein [Geminicoccaceae bacterium]
MGRRTCPALALAAAILATAGCSGDTPRMAATVSGAMDTAVLATLPQPASGDRLVFTTGQPAEVVSSDARSVHWKVGSTTTMTRPRNPFLPYTEFENTKVRIVSQVDAPPDALFPLEVGKTASFTETRQITYKSGAPARTQQRRWNCSVDDEETVKVRAGRFDTFRVRCENPSNRAFFRTLVAHEWNFAPSINQVVRERYERYRNTPRERELVRMATTRPVARGPVFERTVQSVFETRASGTPVAWSDPVSGQNGEIEIRRTFRLADGTYCRDADIALHTAGKPIDQAFRACRDEKGLWVPRLH